RGRYVDKGRSVARTCGARAPHSPLRRRRRIVAPSAGCAGLSGAAATRSVRSSGRAPRASLARLSICERVCRADVARRCDRNAQTSRAPSPGQARSEDRRASYRSVVLGGNALAFKWRSDYAVAAFVVFFFAPAVFVAAFATFTAFAAVLRCSDVCAPNFFV